jgi:GNAT superfamily N-acetyltransferase
LRRNKAGFYTLSAASVALSDLSPEIVRKLPRYPVVPAALLGRLAVARNCQGKGLGGVLLANAVLRAARSEMGVFAMLVDAKDEGAQRFYEHYGFTLLAWHRTPFVPPDCDRAPVLRTAFMSRYPVI